MAKNQVTVDFNADVSGFNSEIKRAGNEMKLFKAEAKNADTQMKENGVSVELLEAKHDALEKQLQASQTKTEALNQKINTAIKYYGENSDEVLKLKTQLANAQSEQVKMESAVEKCAEALKEQVAIEKEVNSATNKLNKEIAEQETKLAQLKKEYTDFVVEGKEATQEAKDLENAIGKLSTELNANKSKLSEASKKADELAKSLDNVEEEAEQSESGFTIMKDAIGDLVADGIQVAIDAFKELMTASSEASANLQAQTGASASEMERFNAEMEDLYANNYGESLQDVANKMSYVAHATDEVDPANIRKLTENAIALEDTFGSDFNETVRGVANMMRHFGIDAETAFDLFAKGSQEGLDYTGELGDNIAEYGGNFAQAGYSAEEYFQLLKNGAEGGAYNLDKVNDAINEAKNRLGDGSIGDNIDVFSKGTQNLFKEWQNGNATMKDVIDSMVGDITNCTNETEALTMAQIAFGTMGEDANLEVVKSLTSVGTAFEDTKGTMESVKDVNYSSVGAQFQQIGRMISTEIIQPLVNSAMPAIQGFADFIINNFNVIGPIIMGVATAFAVLAGALAISNIITAVQKAWSLLNTTMLANPIVLIVAVIAGLVVAFVTLWNNCEGFRNFWIGLWENIKNACSVAVEWLKNAISVAWNAIKSTTSSVWNSIKSTTSSVWNGIKNAVSSVVNGVKTSVSNTWNNIKSATSNAFNSVKSTATTVWNGVKTAILTPIESAKKKISSIVDSIKKMFSNMKLKMPSIKTPKFSISPKGWKVGDLLKGSIPKLSITWHKDGAIFTRPTLFDTSNGLHGVGEAGAEAVLPIEKLENYVVNAIEKTQQKIDLSQMANAIERLAERPIVMKINDRTIAETTASASDSVNGLRNVFRERGLVLE